MYICTLASGSSGNCTLVSSGDTHILVDAGISARRIVAGLSECSLQTEQLSGILITHAHTDHISGLAVLLKKRSIPVYASPETGGELLRQFPALGAQLRLFHPTSPFFLGSVSVLPFPTWHDAPGSVGFRMDDGDTVFAIATDLGRMTRAVADGIEGAELLLLEANYDPTMLQTGPYPPFLKRRILGDYGHLSNDEAGRAAAWAAENGTKTILLGHLSRENNHPDRALETVGTACDRLPGRVHLAVAPRLMPAHFIWQVRSMRNIQILCVGKLKESFYAQAVKEYEKRLTPFCKLEIWETPETRLPDRPSASQILAALEKEAAALLPRLEKGGTVVALCIEGEHRSSEALAEQMEAWAVSGVSKLTFVIGGSYGLAPAVKSRADLRLSLSSMTFPHHLARVMLLEQIYRCFQLQNGTQYHK